MEFWVWSGWFMVLGLEFRAYGLGFRTERDF